MKCWTHSAPCKKCSPKGSILSQEFSCGAFEVIPHVQIAITRSTRPLDTQNQVDARTRIYEICHQSTKKQLCAEPPFLRGSSCPVNPGLSSSFPEAFTNANKTTTRLNGPKSKSKQYAKASPVLQSRCIGNSETVQNVQRSLSCSFAWSASSARVTLRFMGNVDNVLCNFNLHSSDPPDELDRLEPSSAFIRTTSPSFSLFEARDECR